MHPSLLRGTAMRPAAPRVIDAVHSCLFTLYIARTPTTRTLAYHFCGRRIAARFPHKLHPPRAIVLIVRRLLSLTAARRRLCSPGTRIRATRTRYARTPNSLPNRIRAAALDPHPAARARLRARPQWVAALDAPAYDKWDVEAV